MASTLAIIGLLVLSTVPFAEQAFAHPGCSAPCPPRSGGADLTVFAEFLTIAGFGMFLMFYLTSRYEPRTEIRASPI